MLYAVLLSMGYGVFRPVCMQVLSPTSQIKNRHAINIL